MWQGTDGEKCLALGTFSFILESKMCGCQQRNAMNRMGCTGEAGQTSKAGQFLRLHHNTCHMEETLYSILSAIGSHCSLVKNSEACVLLLVLKMSLAEQF